MFLPVFFGVYFVVPPRHRNWVLVTFSWAFYAWWRVDFLALLVVVTVVTFLTARQIGRVGPPSRAGGWLLAAGLVFNLGVLGYFKYANFGVATFNDVITTFGAHPLGWSEIVLRDIRERALRH